MNYVLIYQKYLFTLHVVTYPVNACLRLNIFLHDTHNNGCYSSKTILSDLTIEENEITERERERERESLLHFHIKPLKT